MEKLHAFLESIIKQYTDKTKWEDQTIELMDRAHQFSVAMAPRVRSYLPLIGFKLPIAENWDDPHFIVNVSRETSGIASQLIKDAYQKVFDSLSSDDIESKKLKIKKVEVLKELRNYAEISKNRFNRNLQFSSVMKGASSVFAVISLGAMAARLIPPANLIADGVSKSADFLSYASWTTALKQDPNVNPEEFLASKRHYEWLRDYNKAEAGVGGVGTLAIITGFTVSLTALAATLPLLGPGLLMAGAGAMIISNVVAAISAKQELTHEQAILEKHPLIKALPSVIKKAENGIESLSRDEKTLLKQHQKVQGLRKKYHSKVLNALGASTTAILAIATFVSILFPPAGLLIVGAGLATLTAVTIALAASSAYSRYQQLQHEKQTQLISEKLENDELRSAIATVKKANALGTDSFKPQVDLEVSLKPESTPSTIKPTATLPALETSKEALKEISKEITELDQKKHREEDTPPVDPSREVTTFKDKLAFFNKGINASEHGKNRQPDPPKHTPTQRH